MHSSDHIASSEVLTGDLPVTHHQPAGRPRRIAGQVAWLLALLALAAAVGWAVRVIEQTLVPLVVTVDGRSETVRTTRSEVGQVLSDLGLQLRVEDRIEPALTAPVKAGMSIEVQRARRELIDADGDLLEAYSLATTVGELLAAAHVDLGLHDEVWMNGAQVALATPLPAAAVETGRPRFARPHAWSDRAAQPIRLQVIRAVKLTVDDGAIPYTIFTTAATVGEALLREQLTLYLGDQVQPTLGSRVQAGMRVTIVRSKPVLVTADGRSLRTRSRGKTVGDALAELGVVVSGSDRVSPAMAATLVDNASVRVVRVVQTVLVERQPIPFESILMPDDNLEIDSQRQDQAGVDGEFRRRYGIVYEDGSEITRTLTDAWTAAEPITQVIAYGRKIDQKALPTDAGSLSYWRKVHMYATSYSKATSGVSPSNPHYGRTRLGLPMGNGIVAIDPTIVPLGSRVYVPGYGIGIAADTGGAVFAKHIDLGYDDDDLQMWATWVDVYLLDAPPPSSQIRWVLPNWPRFK